MKRIFKSIFVVFVALTMLFGISATAIADDATVVFKSAQEGFDFGGGSEYGGCAVKSRRGGFGEEHHDQEDRQCDARNVAGDRQADGIKAGAVLEKPQDKGRGAACKGRCKEKNVFFHGKNPFGQWNRTKVRR